MVLVYEVNLYYEIDVLKKAIINDSIKYLVEIENTKYMYEETVNYETGLVTYSLGTETFIPESCVVEDNEYPNLSMIVSLYETMRYSGLPKVKISGRDKSKIKQVVKEDKKPVLTRTRRQPSRLTETKPAEATPFGKKKEEPEKKKKKSSWEEEEFPW